MVLLDDGDTTSPRDAQSAREGPLDEVPVEELPAVLVPAVLVPAVDEPTVEDPLPALVAATEVPPDPAAELAMDTALDAPTDEAGGADVARDVEEDPGLDALVAAPDEDDAPDVLPEEDEEEDEEDDELPVHACVATRENRHTAARLRDMVPAVMVVAPSLGSPEGTLRAHLTRRAATEPARWWGISWGRTPRHTGAVCDRDCAMTGAPAQQVTMDRGPVLRWPAPATQAAPQ